MHQWMDWCVEVFTVVLTIICTAFWDLCRTISRGIKSLFCGGRVEEKEKWLFFYNTDYHFIHRQILSGWHWVITLIYHITVKITVLWEEFGKLTDDSERITKLVNRRKNSSKWSIRIKCEKQRECLIEFKYILAIKSRWRELVMFCFQ